MLVLLSSEYLETDLLMKWLFENKVDALLCCQSSQDVNVISSSCYKICAGHTSQIGTSMNKNLKAEFIGDMNTSSFLVILAQTSCFKQILLYSSDVVD